MNADRFWSKVEKTETCWLWTGGRQSSGYGSLTFDGAHKLAHRVAYELSVGPIPEGLHVDHLCRTRDCVNPAHLEAVSPRENQRRGIKGALTTHCPSGHAYDEANTRIYRGMRYCRECARMHKRRYYRERKAVAA